jgi:organic radical activating enzyme
MIEYLHQGKRFDGPSEFPLHLDLEINSACNYSCTMCPQSLPKKEQGFKQGKMSFVDAKKIIQYCAKKGTKTIKPFWRGEPTINKDLVDVLRIAKVSGLYTQINTNGTFPLDNKVEISKWLDWCSFSIDKYHSNNQDNKDVLNNILIMKKFGVHVEVQTSTPTDKLRTLCAHNDIILKEDVLTKRTPSGDYKHIMLAGMPRKDCNFPNWRMIITWDFKVKPCCVCWPDGDLEMGSLLDPNGDLCVSRIDGIWNGDEYQMLREDQIDLIYSSTACKNCQSASAYMLDEEKEIAID